MTMTWRARSVLVIVCATVDVLLIIRSTRRALYQRHSTTHFIAAIHPVVVLHQRTDDNRKREFSHLVADLSVAADLLELSGQRLFSPAGPSIRTCWFFLPVPSSPQHAGPWRHP